MAIFKVLADRKPRKWQTQLQVFWLHCRQLSSADRWHRKVKAFSSRIGTPPGGVLTPTAKYLAKHLTQIILWLVQWSISIIDLFSSSADVYLVHVFRPLSTDRYRCTRWLPARLHFGHQCQYFHLKNSGKTTLFRENQYRGKITARDVVRAEMVHWSLFSPGRFF